MENTARIKKTDVYTTPEEIDSETDLDDEDHAPLDESATTDDSDVKYFTPEDRSEYPARGHIPGSPWFSGGKKVCNPGLRQTGWTSEE